MLRAVPRLRQLLPQIRPLIRTAGMASEESKTEGITNWVKPGDKSGEFKRQSSAFREWIKNDPKAEFPAESGRYHLYTSLACPWAHRTLIVRKLKGLEDIISFTNVHYEMLEKGWRFATKDEKLPGDNVTPDPVHPEFTHLREIYFENNKDYSGRFLVPTLYDKKQKRIVSNESSEIIRMFYHEFDHLIADKYKQIEFRPEDLIKQIDEANDWQYNDINNGVYKSGFATTQEAYEKNVTQLFKSLDRAETHLKQQKSGPFYFGDRLTETDVRLYTTIVRFDQVYQQHFKCNLRDIRGGYPYLHKWVRNLYWNHPAFHDTTEFTHIKRHYTMSHKQINPYSIVPVGPEPPLLPLDEEVPSVTEALRK